MYREIIMSIVAVAAVTLGMAAPASAQLFVGADNGGAGVQVGPLGVGVGPRFSDDRYYNRGYDRYDRGYRSNAYYANNCRMVRSRVMTPNGNVVYRARRICN
jgi:hypothetical protein